MNTRKSSPLPNLKTDIARYQINYKIHYQEFYRHLLTRIYTEKAKNDQLITQFTELSHKLNSLNRQSLTNTEQSNNKSKQQTHIWKKMESIYHEICKKQLQINKLFQQSEGVILQLCDFLKITENNFKKMRFNNNTKNFQLKFLHYQSLYENESNFSRNNYLEKSKLQKEPRHYQTQEKEDDILKYKQEQSKLIKQIKTKQRLQINQKQSKKLKIDPETIKITFSGLNDANFSNIYNLKKKKNQIEKYRESKDAVNTIVQQEIQFMNQPSSLYVSPSKASSFLKNYQKSKNLLQKITISKEQQCIELNSSRQDEKGLRSIDQVINKQKKSLILKKSSKKTKQGQNSCITILD